MLTGPVLVVVSLAVGSLGQDAEAELLPRIEGAVVASGLCWTISISEAGLLDVRVKLPGEPDVRRPLTPAERSELRQLLRTLPSDERTYSFGYARDDMDETYLVDVGTGPSLRTYSVSRSLEKERGNKNVSAIVRFWIYLRGLFESKTPFDPNRVYEEFTSKPPGNLKAAEQEDAPDEGREEGTQ